MRIFTSLINENDLLFIYEKLLKNMNEKEKILFIRKQFSAMARQSSKGLCTKDKQLFFDSVKKVTENVISENTRPEGKNPDYMCC